MTTYDKYCHADHSYDDGGDSDDYAIIIIITSNSPNQAQHQ